MRVDASADGERHQQDRIAERILIRPRTEPRGQLQQVVGELPGEILRHVWHGRILRRLVRCSKDLFNEQGADVRA